MKKSIYILPILAIFIVTSCEKAFMDKQPENTPTSIFEQVWTFADQNYSFFEYKGVDWDSVKNAYQPKISDDMSDEALFDTLANMLFLLKDGHVNLKSSFNRSRNWHWYLDYPPNYDFNILERNYFKDEQQYLGSFILYDFGDVGYIHYRSFSSTISESDMDYVIEKFKDHKGLIIDVRNNGGGALNNVYTLANRLVAEETEVALEKYKNGFGHDDFTEGDILTLSPVDEKESYTGNVVILTNRLCYSATNFLVTMTSNLPNVTTIGDKTGGGGGIPTFTEISNGWSLRVSSTRLFTLDGLNVENGVEPDIKVEQSQADTDSGKDSILEAALEFLRSK